MYNQTAVLPISKERAAYLQKQKRKKYMIRTIQISVVIILLAMWEILANIGVIDSFIMSQPSRMVKTLLNLGENGLLTHLGVTCMETLIGFLLGTVLGVGLAVLLWWSKTLSRICEPFLVVLNALPKIALGPVFIVWVGAGMQAIIVMALAYLYYRYKGLSMVQGILSGLRPAVVAMITSAGISLLILSLYGAQELPADLSGVDWISMGIFTVAILILRRWKVNPIWIMAGAGAAGVLLYSIL